MLIIGVYPANIRRWLILQLSDSFFRRSISIAFPFFFLSLFFLARLCLFLPERVHWRGRYASEAEVSFLSSLVSSPSSAQAAAKELWSYRLSPQAEAKVRSTISPNPLHRP